jgi:hypothetical protein
MTTFAVVNNPATPLFAEVYNPYIKLIQSIGCPATGETTEVELWFFQYFDGMKSLDREEILAAFDRDGYYETFDDGYIITLYPASENAMIEDSDEAAQESLQDFCALVAANFRALS